MKKSKILLSAGLLLIAAALALTIYNIFDANRASASVSKAAHKLEEMITPIVKEEDASILPPKDNGSENPEGVPEELEKGKDLPLYVSHPDMEMPVAEIDGTGYIGLLEIPACELKLPVISSWSYPNLKLGPCRYSGSAYKGDFVIAAHNYSSHFGRLDWLQPGDLVRFTDIDGNVFVYTVELTETLTPHETEAMTDSGWELSLFTCTLDGSNRSTVRCRLAEK